MRRRFILVGCVLGALSPLAWAQPQEPLRGPVVKEGPAKSSLVERDFKGKLKRPELPPEEAALAFLSLDTDARAKVDAVLADRTRILDKIVVDNVDLVVRLHNAGQARDRRELLTVMTEFMKKLQPLSSRGKLADEVRDALPKEKVKQFDAILAGYRTAAINEATDEARTHNEMVTARTLETRENLASLGQEIKRSYERQISSKTAEFDRIISGLGLNSEQDAKIRGMVVQFAQETKGRADAEQKRGLFFRIMAELDPDQQRHLVALYLGRE